MLYGYYGADSNTALEVVDHANLYWEPAWQPLPFVLANLQRALGMKVVLAVPAYHPDAENETRFFLGRIHDAGLLQNIVALYPIDEPDVAGKTDAEVTSVNAMLRRVMTEFKELADTKLAVIYGCDTGKRPGWASYDWLGCDAYGAGCDNATGGTVWAFAAGLAAHQKLILVPGGADPWRQDPGCFEFKAHSDPKVVAIVAFLWIDHAADGVGRGIRSNGLRPLYCQVGRTIKQDTRPCAPL